MNLTYPRTRITAPPTAQKKAHQNKPSTLRLVKSLNSFPHAAERQA